MKSSKPRRNSIEADYRARFVTTLQPIARALESHISDLLRGEDRIDRITARAKDISSFVKKAEARTERNRYKYSEPLSQIQDQVGARIITFYKCDVDRLDRVIKKFFKPIEFRDRVPESEWEFGYFGRHYVLLLPTEVVSDDMDPELIPDFFELQIKTLFQHAWSEADHDLGYKPGVKPLSTDEQRKLAYASAQAWGADQMFDELFHARAVNKT